jgi:serine/threonine protein kinase/Flp pilus assembly protein TadD
VSVIRSHLNGASAELADLVERLSARLQAGEAIDWSAVEREHPAHAAELRRLRPTLEELAALSGAARDATVNDGPLTGVLGDFRIVGEIGRGAMGVVYEAEQISLGRRVALKVLPFVATLDPRHLARFHNEARAAAGLRHNNIVPVFCVGCERGVHFYAMQFVDGRSLAAVLAELRRAARRQPAGAAEDGAEQPTTLYAAATAALAALSTEGVSRDREYYRRVAQLGVQAAEALEYAHEMGIVHRDVKPGNLLLDDRGSVWVTDFGLAHLQHGEGSLTLTGDLVGTLRYMSPEQAAGKRVGIDHRTDVYSLGATLYELLTLRPAFTGTDRQELLRQVALEEPAAPRKLDRSIPAELETIVLKALEKNPADRYATAQELADDLRRWLDDRPIQARRPTLVQRLRKWARRHRTVVWAAAVVLMLAAAMLAGSIGWQAYDWQARRELTAQAVEQALDESASWQRQRRLPEGLSAARRADGLVRGGTSDESLRKRVEARLADLELLETLENVPLKEAIAVGSVAFDFGRVDRTYGSVFGAAGLDVEGLPAKEVAERLLRTTVAAELASILDWWAHARRENRGPGDTTWQHLLAVAREVEPEGAAARVRDALRSRKRQALVDAAASEGAGDLLPLTLHALAVALREVQAFGPAEALLWEAQRRHPDDFGMNIMLGWVLEHKQPPEPATATRFFQAAAALRPQSIFARLNLGIVLRDAGDLDGAIRECLAVIQLDPKFAPAHSNLAVALTEKGDLNQAISECQAAIKLDPKFAPAHYNLGNALSRKGNEDGAIRAFRQALKLDPKLPLAHHALGTLLYGKRDLDGAIGELCQAIKLKNNFPDAHTTLGIALHDKGDRKGAIREMHEALRFKKDHLDAHVNLGLYFMEQGRWSKAIAAYQAALRIKNDLPQVHCNLAIALMERGRFDEAIAECRAALHLKKDYAEAYNSLGNALRAQGKWDEAIAAYRAALGLKKDYPEAHNNLGIVLAAMGRLDEAIAEFQTALRFKKDDPLTHCNLGQALLLQGRFADALAALKRGSELGSRDPHWRHRGRFAQLIRTVKQLLALERKLARVLAREVQPADIAERVALARLCQKYKKRYATAARLFKEAFAAQPELADDLNTQDRYNAACAAALAGCGQGEDSDKLEPKERAGLRQQALAWLRADLKAYRQVMGKAADKAGPEIAQRMEHWLKDGDLAGVRGAELLARLPEAERQDWQKLWKEVESLRQRAAQLLKTAGSARP